MMCRLKKMKKADDDHREYQRIINQHESYIYDSQARLEDEEFIEFSSEEEREEISNLLTENEDWLMDEATNTTPSEEYKKRYLDMKTAMNRVENRIDEHKRKLEEERKKKEEEERRKKEEEEKKRKEEEEAAKKAEEAAKNATKTEEGKQEKPEEVVKDSAETESSDKPAEDKVEDTPEQPSNNEAVPENTDSSSDEGFCSIDGEGCSDEI